MANLVSDIINEALADLGVIRPGETVSATVQADCFMRLNQMWAGWGSEEAISNALYHQTFTLTAGTNVYNLGTGGTLVATAIPLKVTGATSSSGNFRNTVKVVSFAEFDLLASDPLGSSSVLATLLAADTAYPAINLRVFPMPAGGSLTIEYFGAMTAFATVGTSLSLHPAFEEALHFNLAVVLAPRYGRQGYDPTVLAANAQTSKARIVDLNRGAPKAPPQ